MSTSHYCPSCAATTRQTKAGKSRCGTQRRHCQHCRRFYTPQARKKGYSQDTCTLALKMVVDGTSLRRTARLVEVCHQSVVTWVNAPLLPCPRVPLLFRPPSWNLTNCSPLWGRKKQCLRGVPGVALPSGTVRHRPRQEPDVQRGRGERGLASLSGAFGTKKPLFFAQCGSTGTSGSVVCLLLQCPVVAQAVLS